jgi:hypothetical protein
MNMTVVPTKCLVEFPTPAGKLFARAWHGESDTGEHLVAFIAMVAILGDKQTPLGWELAASVTDLEIITVSEALERFGKRQQ